MSDLFSGYQTPLLIVAFPGIVEGIILTCIIYFYPKKNVNSSLLLSLFIASLTILLTEPFLLKTYGLDALIISVAFKIATVVFLYLYIKSLSQNIGLLRSLKHFIIIPFYISLSFCLIKVNTNELVIDESIASIMELLVILIDIFYILFYVFLYYRAYRAHMKIETKYLFDSTFNQPPSGFIKKLLIGFLSIMVLNYIVYGMMVFYPNHIYTLCIFYYGGISVYIFYIMIYGKINPGIYTLNILEHGRTKQSIKSNVEAPDDTELLNEISQKVIGVLQKDKLYKTEALTIKELGEKIGFQSYLVSQAINTILKKTFFELVNEYRIEDAKKLLENPELNKLSLVAIGFEAGFNSKSSFNTLFKKHTGFTPSEYKKLQQSKNPYTIGRADLQVGT